MESKAKEEKCGCSQPSALLRRGRPARDERELGRPAGTDEASELISLQTLAATEVERMRGSF